MPAYSASKHGVVGLTKTAAIEVAARGIRVNAVCPGPTLTPLVEAVAKSLGAASRAEAERAVTAVVDSIKTGIRKDKTVQLVGFGTFRVAERAARMGVNPKTGQKIKIKKSKTVKFAAGKEPAEKDAVPPGGIKASLLKREVFWESRLR